MFQAVIENKNKKLLHATSMRLFNDVFKWKINNNKKYDQEQYILGSFEFDISTNNGNSYLPGPWLKVHSDIRNKNNWSVSNENSTFPTQK